MLVLVCSESVESNLVKLDTNNCTVILPPTLSVSK